MSKRFIPYGCQYIDDDDIEAVVQALHDPLITQGPRVESFEAALAAYCGTRYAVCFNSGTSALHGAVFAAGVGVGDEVITSAITFVASANAAVYTGARPVLVDINRDSYCLDIDMMEDAITERTRAIVAVDYAGYPVDLVRIRGIADRHGLTVIEDAAHALGAKRNGQMVGSQADMTMFSFHPVKHITTGEGGVVVCNDEVLYQRLRLLRSHGITRDGSLMENDDGPWYYEMQELGYNYRITDIQCALGQSQLQKIEASISSRTRIARHYDEALCDLPWLDTPPPGNKNDRHAYHLYPIVVKPLVDRKALFNYLRESMIGVQVHYIPLHLHPFYRRTYGYLPGDFPEAEAFYAGEISLPMYASLTQADQDYVIDRIRNFPL